MGKRSTDQIRQKTDMAKKIFNHHFGKGRVNINYKPAGRTNYVFEIKSKAGQFIIRLADDESKISDFIKEQWVVARVKKAGIPVANILEVGNEVVSTPYMLQEKMEGEEAADHPERLKILRDLGRYSRIIHTIGTSGFGPVFDWSENQLSKNATWKEFLENELDVRGRVEVFRKNKIFSKSNLSKFLQLLGKIEKWNKQPTLNHGDIRLKNVIVNADAKIIAIIDWEHATSNIAPFWDFSIALHDLSIDAKQEFLDGYGIDVKQFSRMAYALKVFNLINYAPKIERLSARKDKKSLELYRLRLNGYLDLYSL